MASEKRLIDANALRNQVMNEIRHYWNCGEGGYYLAEDVIPDIDNAPTVDAVEVVRCKDCKRACVVVPPLVKEESLVCTNSVNWRAVKADHFCSYGERREGE